MEKCGFNCAFLFVSRGMPWGTIMSRLLTFLLVLSLQHRPFLEQADEKLREMTHKIMTEIISQQYYFWLDKTLPEEE